MGVREFNEMLREARKKKAQADHLEKLHERESAMQEYSAEKQRAASEQSKKEMRIVAVGVAVRSAKIAAWALAMLVAVAICVNLLTAKPPSSNAKLLAEASTPAGPAAREEEVAVRTTISDVVALAAAPPRVPGPRLTVTTNPTQSLRDVWDPFSGDAALNESVKNLQDILSVGGKEGFAVTSVTFDSPMSHSTATGKCGDRQRTFVLRKGAAGWRVTRID